MAAKTASTLEKYSFGSMTLYVATFTDIDDGDSWASGIPYPVAYWGNLTDDPTAQTNNALNIGLTTASTGAFAFYSGEDDRAAKIYVLTESIA